MRRFALRIADLLIGLGDVPPLFFRLTVAYFLFTTTIESHHSVYGILFAVLGLILLPLGLLTRLISAVLIVVIGFTVEWKLLAEQMIPLYLMLMLFSLVVYGPGCISLDGLFKRRMSKESK